MQRSRLLVALAALVPLAACGSDPNPAPVVVNTPPSAVVTTPATVVPAAPPSDVASLIQKCQAVLRDAYPNQNLAFGAPRAEPSGDLVNVSIPYVVGVAGSQTVNQTYGCRFQSGLMTSSGVRPNM